MHQATIVHQLPGRMRVRIARAQNDREFFAQVRQVFGNMQGIRSVETNYLTGSILFQYTGEPHEIEQTAAREGLFKIRREALPLPAAAMMQVSLSSVRTRLNRFSGSRIDFQGAALLLLAGGSLLQMLRKNVWPAGVTLLWYAANILKDAKPPANLAEPMNSARSANDYVQ